jgi:acyl transferase domain-containing protein
VQFKKGLVELLKEPERVMLEVGPRGTLSSFVMQHPARMTRQFALSSLRHPSETQADETFLLGVLGQLWLAGVDVDWRGGYVDEQRRRVPLPTYPFERQIYSLMGQGVGQCCAQQVGTVQTQTPAELEVTSVSDNGSPQDEPEQLILEIWQEVFGLEHVGVHDNFFDLGGNSLIGIQLMARLRKKFQMELPMRHLFESPTVAGLASVIANTKVKTHDLEEIEQILTEIENLSAQNRHA